MIEPISKRSIEDNETVKDLKQQNDLLKRKVDECEFIIHKAQKKTAKEEEFNKKIENNGNRLKLMEI